MELESILIGVGIGFIGGSIMTCLMLRSTKKGVNDLIKRVIENPDKWKERFMQMIGFDEKLIEYLKLKEKYKTDKEMIKKFSWGRSTFYRIKQEAEE